MTPTDLVLDRLTARDCRPQRSGDQWAARCPAHDDTRASLGIKAGDDGRCLVTCRAQCSTETVVAALGLTMADLMPSGNGQPHKHGNGKSGSGFASVEGAIGYWKRKRKSAPSCRWDYHDASGRLVGVILRWDTAAGKEIRPAMFDGRRWQPRGMTQPRPLYQLPEVMKAETVYVTEGEKAADAARTLGFTATTPAHGAKSPRRTDWSPLKGKSAVVFPDYDEPGDEYARDVARLALAANARAVKIVPMTAVCSDRDLPKGYDLADALAECEDHDERDGLRMAVQEAAEATPYITTESVSDSRDGTRAPASASKSPAVPAGTRVLAGDRGNIGTVVADHGDTCLVHFVSPEGQHAEKDLPKSQLRLQDGSTIDAESTEPPLFATSLISSADFDNASYKMEFQIRDVLVSGQQCVLGGRSKTNKTGIAIDLVVSLASGTLFLNHFQTKQSRVGFWSGESGAATIQGKARRCAEARGVRLADCSAFWSFDLPKLGRLDHVAAMAGVVQTLSLDVVVVDPLYLSLLDGTEAGRPGDLFFMGSKLLPLSELGQRTGVTIVLLHHFRKSGSGNDGGDDQAALEELSQSGVAEWARQWLLLARRSPYQHDGHHALWLRCGGSAGHAGLYGVDIVEGTIDEHFDGRRWEVEVTPGYEVKKVTQQERKQAKEEKKREQEQADQKAIVEAVSTKLQRGEGAFPRKLGAWSGIFNQRLDRAITLLVEQGILEPCEALQAPSHKMPKPGAYRLTEGWWSND